MSRQRFATRTADGPRCGPRRDGGQAARGAALLLLVSLIAGGASAGVAEAIARIAVAAGVEGALARQPLPCAQGLALHRQGWSIRAARPAAARSLWAEARSALRPRSALGTLTLCDLPPPLA
ncbi:MAG: hypothetical protein D6824_06985 [Planctomycetota bacterium]|nr:MAG: hypothetical protein D6824_06985 [Planctomycetota bacterium]